MKFSTWEGTSLRPNKGVSFLFLISLMTSDGCLHVCLFSGFWGNPIQGIYSFLGEKYLIAAWAFPRFFGLYTFLVSLQTFQFLTGVKTFHCLAHSNFTLVRHLFTGFLVIFTAGRAVPVLPFVLEFQGNLFKYVETGPATRTRGILNLVLKTSWILLLFWQEIYHKCELGIYLYLVVRWFQIEG